MVEFGKAYSDAEWLRSRIFVTSPKPATLKPEEVAKAPELGLAMRVLRIVWGIDRRSDASGSDSGVPKDCLKARQK